MASRTVIPEHPPAPLIAPFDEWVRKVVDARWPQVILPQSIWVEQVYWPMERIRNVLRTNESVYQPRRPYEPIVVLVGLSKDYLLDGNRRINTWLRDKDIDSKTVLAVYPRYLYG